MSESGASESEDFVEIFVPGRLCILGEHSDWAAEYGSSDPEVPNGYTLVCATNEGLFARCRRRSDGYLVFKRGSDEETLRIPLDEDTLVAAAQAGGFWSYVAGTAAIMLRHLPQQMSTLSGVEIDNYETTLPLRKGLSSSAAVCVLVVRALAALCLPSSSSSAAALSTTQTMALAYAGESLTPSGCGRMDQCVAMGRGAIALMTFPASHQQQEQEQEQEQQHNDTCALQIDDGGVSLERLVCAQDLFFVVCDVSGSKDTVVILRDLRRSLHEPYPLSPPLILSGVQSASNEASSEASNEASVSVGDSRALFLRYLRDVQSLSCVATRAVRDGHTQQLADCMRAAQQSFDDHCLPLSRAELSAPKLHALIGEVQGRAGVLAAKGVGSQGDGALQALCESEAAQTALLRFLREEKCLSAFALTVPASSFETETETEAKAA